ncbi:hypothetical protein CFK37_18995 [Virgibacillus phasianinus]|uniref:Lipoprotein n=1 Tax=Virgibacillus phasianinus TaxID=2017483 RepID=A0A220U7Y6_9BACI|nr:hypothetical protein [Virgibacillus phasianinus]ASK64092.1 hypothetical protein CFK37_18995 [Virgibacillus phasianinus]
MKYQIVPLMIILLLLSACSGNKEAIKIEDKGMANALFIQKVEDNIAKEEMTKFVRDKDKIKNVLSMVEGLKVKEMVNENFFREMESQNSYTLGFSEKEKFEATGEPMPYAFYILEDGTFAFPYDGFNSQHPLRVTKEKHPQLLKKIKKLLDIDF